MRKPDKTTSLLSKGNKYFVNKRVLKEKSVNKTIHGMMSEKTSLIRE